MLDSTLQKSLQIYRASSSIRKKKLSDKTRSPQQIKEIKLYIVAFWKFNPLPLNHPLDANGQHPIFASMKNIKHYRCKLIKTPNNNNEFAVLFKVKQSSITSTISNVNKVFHDFDSDIEMSGDRIEDARDEDEAMDRLQNEYGYPM